MPNWALINWTALGLLGGLAFVASLIGQAIVGRNPFVGAILTAVIFVAAYVFWNYGQFPHPDLFGGLRFPDKY